MEKIYGYKEKDVIGLAEFILSSKSGTLKETFKEYAFKSGKAQGTIRNLYYALAKKSKTDEEFCQKYLGGKPLSVGKIEEFSKDDEEFLINSILKERIKGRSVRSIIYELALGNEKKALRYQNKFRNYIKNNPEQVERITLELAKNGNAISEKLRKEVVKETQIKKLKGEINSLVEKISLAQKKENDKLKDKISFLERENQNLKQELSQKTMPLGVLNYFATKDGTRIFN